MILTIPNYLFLDLNRNLINYSFKITTINHSNVLEVPEDRTK